MADDVYALRIAFEHALATREDVAAWVDAEVMRRDSLPPALLELATLSGKTVDEIVKLLEVLERDHAALFPHDAQRRRVDEGRADRDLLARP